MCPSIDRERDYSNLPLIDSPSTTSVDSNVDSRSASDDEAGEAPGCGYAGHGADCVCNQPGKPSTRSSLPTLIDAPHGRGHVYVTTAEAGAPKSSRFNGSDDEPPARQNNEVPLGIQDGGADDGSRFNGSSDEPPTWRGREGRQHRNIEGFFESTLEVMVGAVPWAAELLVTTVDAIAGMMKERTLGKVNEPTK